MYWNIYHILFEAYRRVSDRTNAIGCNRKLVTINRECCDTAEEREPSVALTLIY